MKSMIETRFEKLSVAQLIDANLDRAREGLRVIEDWCRFGLNQKDLVVTLKDWRQQLGAHHHEVYKKARDISKKDILIAGGLPNQKQTYTADLGKDLNTIKKNFYDQAKVLRNGIDFYYLDVMSSGLECEIALETIESFNLPVLVGVHLRDNGLLPSGEKIEDIVKKYKNKNWLGIIMACVSPKAYEAVNNNLEKIGIPYGFKLNAFNKIPVGYNVASKDAWGNAGNPNTVLGRNTELNESKFYEYAKKFMENGATILGGCCEIGPSHIKEISKLK